MIGGMTISLKDVLLAKSKLKSIEAKFGDR